MTSRARPIENQVVISVALKHNQHFPSKAIYGHSAASVASLQHRFFQLLSFCLSLSFLAKT
jgi:hypothetical protein